MTRTESLVTQHKLLTAWTETVERALVTLGENSPESLHALTAERLRLIEQWQQLRIDSIYGNFGAVNESDAALIMQIRITARRALLLDRQYEQALRERDRFVRSRLQMLCSAAGIDGVYGGGGTLTPLRSPGGTTLHA